MYQNMDNNLKTAIWMTSIQLNTADGSPMTALAKMTLQLRIADIRFSHNFIICDRLPQMELLFGIDVQKKFSLSFAWDREKNCYIQMEGRSFTYTRNCEQKANVAIIKSALKILPATMTLYQSRSKDIQLRENMAYFISDQDSKKGMIPTYTLLMESIISKKNHMLIFLFSNYSNKHITFNKGEK